MKHKNLTLDLDDARKTSRELYPAKHWKVIALRETPGPADMMQVINAEDAVKYYRQFIETDERYSNEVEQAHVLMLNTRARCIGHVHIGTGTKDTVVADPTTVYRAAVIANANSIVMLHNHPGGDPTPSEADLRMTAKLLQAGKVLDIRLNDSIVIGQPEPTSSNAILRDGYVSIRGAVADWKV